MGYQTLGAHRGTGVDPSTGRRVCRSVIVAGLVLLGAAAGHAEGPRSPASPAAASGTFDPTAQQALLNQYCVTCHNSRARVGNLTLDSLDVAAVGAHPEIWEKVVRK